MYNKISGYTGLYGSGLGTLLKVTHLGEVCTSYVIHNKAGRYWVASQYPLQPSFKGQYTPNSLISNQ